ncbi:TadE/TadG family type IV pilus assembly protein [Pseudokordiimonas caeni]|uniref:TadE/TadG family type IV pilus assembly protein n=1 Tax=Pseudokordiimonas caeni TaxID=2997908 RepID=UPI002810D47A|nr:VWA domain-containing protein [Pseudokordiimonas caeni]
MAELKRYSFRRQLKSLRRDERGSMMPIIASGIITCIGAAGLAIDATRMFYVHDILQKSLDSAGLAAGHAMYEDQMESDANDFFYANMAAAGSVAIDPDFDINISENNKVISVTGSAKVATTFMRLFGYDKINVNASTEITRETRGMELVLVMDNTGSMRGTAITAMKNAAADLVETVYGDNDTNPNLWVGLVPYSAMVNIGSEHDDWLTWQSRNDIANGQFSPSSWKGCVMAREDDGDETDETPTDAPFTAFFWANSSDNMWNPWSGKYFLNEGNDAQNNGRGPNLGCGPAITPLVASKATVLAAIDEMLPWHRGGTTSNLGLVWGWRVISPAWRGLWGGDSPANLPLAYNTPFMNKVVVLLTDGANQFYDWNVRYYMDGSKLRTTSNSTAGPSGSDFTAYGRLNDMGVYSLQDGQNILDAKLANTCADMKTEGIIIYTITFGSSPNSQTKSLYRNCASNTSFYYHAPDDAELAEVFDTIGKQLSNLRLSQ